MDGRRRGRGRALGGFPARSRYSRGRAPEPGVGLREMLLQQCIVSGVVLIIALAISFLPMRFAVELRGGIKHALAQESTADSLLKAADGLTGTYDSLQNSLKAIFGDGTTTSRGGGGTTSGLEYAPGEGIPAKTEAPHEYAAPTGTTDEDAALRDNEVRIDEDVLNSINGGEHYEVSETEKKP